MEAPRVNGVNQPDPAVSSVIQPMFLFADSQLLFHREGGVPFLRRAIAGLEARGVGARKASYLGASNGDEPAFYEIFAGAMDGVGIKTHRHITASPSAEDRAFLDESDLVLLAGGDVERGHRAFEASGLYAQILARYAAGAVLLGVSAGAIQLGQRGFRREDASSFPTFGLAPAILDAHQEPEWAVLARVVEQAGEHGRGIGIPLGAAAIVHADLMVEPVRKPLVEIAMVDGRPRRSLLMPP
jgi:Peptidase family S51